MPAQHDDKYYLDTVTFLVEDRLFRVLKQPFLESDIFCTTFSLPSGDRDAEGSNDDNPFTLEGVKADEFRALLTVMMPLTSLPSALSEEQWCHVLKLSTMWQFANIRQRAIEELSKHLGAEDQIRLGREYKVFSWLKDGLASVIWRHRFKSMSEKEKNNLASKLGWETTARILYLRQIDMDPFDECSNCRSELIVLQCSKCRESSSIIGRCDSCGCYAYLSCTTGTEISEARVKDRVVQEEFAADFQFFGTIPDSL